MKAVNCKSCNNWILDKSDILGRFYSVYCERCRKKRIMNHASFLQKEIEEAKRKELH